MSKLFKRLSAVLLSLAIVLSIFPIVSPPVHATTGYDRGYSGSMAGDGVIYAHGLDVSSWQGASLDFQNFKNAGYDYVILRCGTTKGKDECFETYYAKAKAAGLDVGVYYYSYALTVSQAASDAANVLSWISGKQFEYPVYFDFEDPSQKALDPSLCGTISRTFMDTLADAGYLVGFYSMASWMQSSWLTSSGIRGTYEGWIAHYPSTNSNTGISSGVYNKYHSTYSSSYGMYQYSASTYVNGAGPYDCNVCYKDYPSIVKTYGFNGYSAANTHTITFDSNGGSKVEDVLVEDGKPLTAPANPTRYGFNFLGWYCDPELNDPYDFSTPVPYSFTLYAKWEEAYWGANTNLLPVDGLLVREDYQGTGQYIWPYYNADGSVTMYNGVTNDANWSWPNAYMAYENSFDSGNDAYIYVKYSATAMFNATIDYLDSDGNAQSVTLSQLAGNGDADFPAGDHELLLNLGQYIYDQGHLTTSDGSTHSRNVKYTKVTYYVVGELDSYVRLYDMRLTYCNTVSFETNGGSAVDSLEIANGAILSAPNTPTRLGYDFMGWCTDNALTIPYQFSSGVNSDLTLYAKWEEAKWPPIGSMLPVPGELEYVDFQGSGQSVWDYYNDDGSVTLYNAVNTTDYSWPSGYMVYQNVADISETPFIYLNFRCDYAFNGEISYLDDNGQTHVVSLSTLAELDTTDFTAGSHDLYLDFAAYLNAQGHMPASGELKITKVAYYVVGTTDSYARIYDLRFTAEGAKPIVQPVITVGSPSVSFEGEIRYNIYFSASQLDDVAEMGLVLFNTKVADGTIENADQVIPGYSGENGSYMVHTDGIAPKNMGDALYFRIYAKLTDGSYIYTTIRGYNAIVYANNILKNSTDANMRSLVVAMLNYGAAAQQSLNYKTDSLMNAGLTAEQQALVKPYDADMMDDLVSVPSVKVGKFAYNSAGYSGRKPSVSFDGAFAINYYFTTNFAPENGMKLYYWTLADYNACGVLTAGNATGSMDMVDLGSNQFWGNVEDIVAKNIDETVFVAAVYTYGGVEYATGVLAYSVGSYCESMIAAEAGSATQAMTPICSGAAVYGFYAKEYFASL